MYSPINFGFAMSGVKNKYCRRVGWERREGEYMKEWVFSNSGNYMEYTQRKGTKHSGVGEGEASGHLASMVSETLGRETIPCAKFCRRVEFCSALTHVCTTHTTLCAHL